MIVDLANLLKVCFNTGMGYDEVSTTVYKTEAYDEEMEAQKHIHNILAKSGLFEEITREDEMSGKIYNHYVFRMSDQKEDEEQGFDVSIGFPIKNESGKQTGFKYQHLDHTSAVNPSVLNDKREKERKTGTIIWQLPPRILRYADLGGTEFVKEVMHSLWQALDLE